MYQENDRVFLNDDTHERFNKPAIIIDVDDDLYLIRFEDGFTMYVSEDELI